MKPAVKITLIVIIAILLISSIFSMLGALLGIAFGVIGAAFGFAWRVIFSPIILIVCIVWLVSKIAKNNQRR